MDWLLLAGIVVIGVLLLVAMLRTRREPRERGLPTWLPVTGLAVAAPLFALSVVSGAWTSAALFGLNLIVFSMLLGMSTRRTPR